MLLGGLLLLHVGSDRGHSLLSGEITANVTSLLLKSSVNPEGHEIKEPRLAYCNFLVPSGAAGLPRGHICQFTIIEYFEENSSDEVTLWSEECDYVVQTDTENRITGWGVGDYG
jgi:hypothetical protein